MEIILSMRIILFHASNSRIMNKKLKASWVLDQAEQYSTMFSIPSAQFWTSVLQRTLSNNCILKTATSSIQFIIYQHADNLQNILLDIIESLESIKGNIICRSWDCNYLEKRTLYEVEWSWKKYITLHHFWMNETLSAQGNDLH